MSDDVDFTGVILEDRDMSVKFRGRTWEPHEFVFLPKSRIAVVHRSAREGYRDGEVTVTVPRWLAEAKEMV